MILSSPWYSEDRFFQLYDEKIHKDFESDYRAVKEIEEAQENLHEAMVKGYYQSCSKKCSLI